MSFRASLIDYDALAKLISAYDDEAETIERVIKAILESNGECSNGGWVTKTSEAFCERIQNDHVPKLRSAADALRDVAEYLRRYSQNKEDEDAQDARAILG